MLGTLPPMNWSQISEKIPSSFIIISHKEWDGGEGRSEEKDGRSQVSIIGSGSQGTQPCVSYSL